MNPIQVAIYAHVSSEQQNEANAIQRQLVDLLALIAAERLTLLTEQELVDKGFSGAMLIRPALEQLRDVAAAGGIDRLYFHYLDC